MESLAVGLNLAWFSATVASLVRIDIPTRAVLEAAAEVSLDHISALHHLIDPSLYENWSFAERVKLNLPNLNSLAYHGSEPPGISCGYFKFRQSSQFRHGSSGGRVLNPSNRLTNPLIASAGRITSTVGSSRQLQFGLKLVF